MFLICLIGVAVTAFLQELFKSLGIFALLFIGFCYFGAIPVLGWFNHAIPSVLIPLSIAFIITFLIFWICQLRLSSTVTLVPVLGYVLIHYWIVDNFPSAIVMTILIGIPLVVLWAGMNGGADEFCDCWDLEKPGDNGKRCEWCGSSRVHEDRYFARSYDHLDSFCYCKKCGCSWDEPDCSAPSERRITKRGKGPRKYFNIDPHVK